MDIEQRISQFENMCREDPDNDMAHFSLAGAYAQAGRHRDAAESYLKSVQANAEMSKAWQLAGASLIKAGEKDRAISTLTEGYAEAAKRGDMLPARAMKEMLEELGAPVPEVESTAPEAMLEEGAFVCHQTGRAGTQLPGPPFKGPIGEWIHQNISAQTWHAWIGQGTKVINELRLDLSRDEDSKTYDQHMHEFLGLTNELIEKLSRQEQGSAS